MKKKPAKRAPRYRVEDGAASIIVTLHKGRIEVRHGESKTLLAYRDRAPLGTWAAIWSLFNAMGFKRNILSEGGCP